MNVNKIIAALKETDQLVCGVLSEFENFDSEEKGINARRCSLGQLFHAAGKTDKEIQALEKLGGNYVGFFNGLLLREYGLTVDDVNAFWTSNDQADLGVVNPDDMSYKGYLRAMGAERLAHMIAWVPKYCETIQPGKCS